MERERRVMSKVFMSGLEIEEGFGVEGKLFGREVQDFCGSFCDVREVCRMIEIFKRIMRVGRKHVGGIGFD